MSRRFESGGPPAVPAAVFCVVVIAATLAVAARASVLTRPGARPVARWAATITPDAARAALARLPETDLAPEIAYDRIRDFGPAWADVDHNGCDTRNDVLRRDLTDVTFGPDAERCIVTTGTLVEPYLGRATSFARTDASALQIDHVVPLHAAWMLGAWRWPADRRVAFANDPRNLVAVDGPANRAKGDALADRWVPPDTAIHCVYAINTVAVHRAYRLAVTRSERHALRGLLRRCP